MVDQMDTQLVDPSEVPEIDLEELWLVDSCNNILSYPLVLDLSPSILLGHCFLTRKNLREKSKDVPETYDPAEEEECESEDATADSSEVCIVSISNCSQLVVYHTYQLLEPQKKFFQTTQTLVKLVHVIQWLIFVLCGQDEEKDQRDKSEAEEVKAEKQPKKKKAHQRMQP